MERKKVGEVFHYFGHIGVAAIRLTDGAFAIGDIVQIQGPSTNVEQTVDSLQIEHVMVDRADRGQEVGMKVRDRVREKDFVYKMVEPAAPVKPTTPPKPKAASTRKAPVKRKPAPKRKSRSKRRARPKRKPGPKRRAGPKQKARVRKASRAQRKKARRGSRKSRSR